MPALVFALAALTYLCGPDARTHMLSLWSLGHRVFWPWRICLFPFRTIFPPSHNVLLASIVFRTVALASQNGPGPP